MISSVQPPMKPLTMPYGTPNNAEMVITIPAKTRENRAP